MPNDPPNEKSGIRRSVVSGSFWTLGGYGSSQVLRLGSHLILAWLLAPQIFGLMALVKVVMHGLEMFSDVGIKPSIIQNKRGDDPEFLNTAWTIQVIRGFLLWLCACLIAWPFAAIYARNDPAAWQLLYLLPVASFTAVLAGFQSTAVATLNKHLRIGRLTTLEISTQVVSLSVMIGWAIVSPTVWAMVAGGLVGGVYKLIASHRIVPGVRVRFAWNSECAAELFKFGKWIFLSTLFTFLALNLDKLILGKVLTLAELGLYSIAFVFGKVALYTSTRLGGTVLFPVYSRYQDDPKRLMSIALRARDVVLWAGSSVSVCFAIAAPLFFETLWDERYHAAGWIAQWISLYVWSMIVLLTADRIPLALGNSRLLFTSNVVRCAGIGLAVLGYWLAGLPGFICGLSVGPFAAHVYVLRGIPYRRWELLRQSLVFTGMMLVYGIGAIAATNWMRGISEAAWIGSVGVLAGAPILIAGRVVWNRLRKKKPGRTIAIEAAPAAAEPA